MVVISIPAFTSTNSGAPSAVFATCPDTDTTMMLEFQGVIEMDGSTFAGNKLGLLSILDGGAKAQMVIGNHRLDGKVMKLDKALLLIQKRKTPKPTVESMDMDGQNAAPSIDPTWQPGTQHYSRSKTMDSKGSMSRQSSAALAHSIKDDDDDDSDDEEMNPIMDYNASARTNTEQQSSAGPNDDDFNPLAPENLTKRSRFDCVAIIRQKILFNAMPVPIIHPDRRGLTVIKRGV
ncbi:hypothetical protein BG004_004834 [Podila humilis]|nr:hypothetical protein BG004_004834 [Podila humilis]